MSLGHKSEGILGYYVRKKADRLGYNTSYSQTEMTLPLMRHLEVSGVVFNWLRSVLSQRMRNVGKCVAMNKSAHHTRVMCSKMSLAWIVRNLAFCEKP